MLRRNVIVIFATISLFVDPSFAADTGANKPSPEYEKCIKASGVVDFAMADCAGDETGRHDKALNLVYRQLNTLLTPEDRAALVKSERAWIAYRDAECAYQSATERGGTMERLIYANCQMALTMERENELKSDLEFAKKFPK